MRSYWLDLFTGTTWDEFLKAGGNVSGFRESKWTTVQKIKPGDYLLCYMIGISRFIGILEVKSEAFKSEERIWKDQVFPCRLKVKPFVTLTPEIAVPIHNFRENAQCFSQRLASSRYDKSRHRPSFLFANCEFCGLER
jgi:predicted RNA-binding protein